MPVNSTKTTIVEIEFRDQNFVQVVSDFLKQKKPGQIILNASPEGTISSVVIRTKHYDVTHSGNGKIKTLDRETVIATTSQP